MSGCEQTRKLPGLALCLERLVAALHKESQGRGLQVGQMYMHTS